MTWIAATLRAHPEVALFATLALGYALGRVRVGRAQLNPVIGVLIVGLLIGQLGIVVPDALKWAFFALFMFAIGYEIGPQFFRGLRAGVASQVVLTLFFCAVSLASALALASLLHFGIGTAAGAYSGGLTQSAAIGTSVDAIGRLPLDAAQRQQLATDVTIGYAVAYIAGLVASVWSVAWLAPRLLRIDLAAECRELEAKLGVGAGDAGVVSAYRAFVARAYDVPAPLAGRSVAALEASFAPQRAFVERVRRRGEIVPAEPDTLEVPVPLRVRPPRPRAISQPSNQLVLERPRQLVREVEHGTALRDHGSVLLDAVLERRLRKESAARDEEGGLDLGHRRRFRVLTCVARRAPSSSTAGARRLGRSVA
jgi:putative transport protein